MSTLGWSIIGLAAVFVFVGLLPFVLRKLKAGRRRAVSPENGNVDQELAALEREAVELYRNGRFQESCAACQQGMSLAARHRHREFEARFGHHLGVVLHKLGRYEEALAAIRKAWAYIEREGEPRDLIAAAKTNLKVIEQAHAAGEIERSMSEGNRLLSQLNPKAAASYFRSAAEFAEKASLPREAAEALCTLAHCHAETGQYAEARTTLQRADSLAKRRIATGDPIFVWLRESQEHCARLEKSSEAVRLYDAANNHLRRYESDKALPLAEEALEASLRTFGADHWYTAIILNARGTALMGLGGNGAARADFERALAIMQEWPDRVKEHQESMQKNLARVKGEMGF